MPASKMSEPVNAFPSTPLGISVSNTSERGGWRLQTNAEMEFYSLVTFIGDSRDMTDDETETESGGFKQTDEDKNGLREDRNKDGYE